MASLLPFLMVMCLFSSTIASTEYNVLDFGAVSDGETDCTESFHKAWESACCSVRSAVIRVPAGRFLLRNVVFGNCQNSNITMFIEGTIVAPSDYNVIGHMRDWIKFKKVSGVSVIGGTLDGQGTSLWDCKLGNSSNHCPTGATSLRFFHSKDILIQGLVSVNSQKVHLNISSCENVRVEGVNITAPANSPNTDGIHVAGSTGVTITWANIGTGDDCISIGPGTTNLWVENIACGPGHGVSIGSLGWGPKERGVRNVTVKTAVFTDTQNGFRIKTWARPSGGFVYNVLFQDAMMNNVQNPIIIDQHYCPALKNCPKQASGVKIRGITYKGIKGTSASEVAVDFNCSIMKPCSGIILDGVELTYKNEPAQSFCASADGQAYHVVRPSSCL